MTHKYVFVLAPPWSGSTVLARLLVTADNVGGFFAPKGQRGHAPRGEGQFLPGARPLLRDIDIYDTQANIDWPQIKQIFENSWDLSHEWLLEKSPPHIFRAKDIEKVFDPAWFVIMVRDPYAHIEGIDRRTDRTLRSCAEQWVLFMQAQYINEHVLERQLSITYEQLTNEPDAVADGLRAFLPAVAPLDVTRSFRAKSIRDEGAAVAASARPLTNFNDEKVARFSATDFDDINAVLREHQPLLAHFGYGLREFDSSLVTPVALDAAPIRENDRRWQLWSAQELIDITGHTLIFER